MGIEDGLFAQLARFRDHHLREAGPPECNKRVCTSRMYAFPVSQLGVEVRYTGDDGGPVFEVTSWHYDAISRHFWYDGVCFTQRACTHAIVVEFLQLVSDLDMAIRSGRLQRLGADLSEGHQHVGVVVGRCHPLAVAVP